MRQLSLNYQKQKCKLNPKYLRKIKLVVYIIRVFNNWKVSKLTKWLRFFF